MIHTYIHTDIHPSIHPSIHAYIHTYIYISCNSTTVRKSVKYHLFIRNDGSLLDLLWDRELAATCCWDSMAVSGFLVCLKLSIRLGGAGRSRWDTWCSLTQQSHLIYVTVCRYRYRYWYRYRYRYRYCMYVCLSVCMHGWMDAWMHGCMDAWMHGCMYVRTYVRTHVRMYHGTIFIRLLSYYMSWKPPHHWPSGTLRT